MYRIRDFDLILNHVSYNFIQNLMNIAVKLYA